MSSSQNISQQFIDGGVVPGDLVGQDGATKTYVNEQLAQRDTRITAATTAASGAQTDINLHKADNTVHVQPSEKAGYNAHIADTTIHVTPAEKQIWNGKAPGTTQTDLTAHIGNSDIHTSPAEKTKLADIQYKAEVNQNAFSTVNDVVAGSKTDTFFIVGGIGITVSTDPVTKKVTITATGSAAPGPHASTHITGGSDRIPDAVMGGNSGLMSGADAQFVRVDGETKAGSKAKADSVQSNLNTHLADKVYQGEVHGMRATTGKFEYYNGTEWITVKGGGGVPVGNVSAFTATSGNTQVTLKWSDPADIVASGVTIAKWVGTKIMRKVGSYPESEKDGVLVVNSTVRDNYKTNGFSDTGLINDTMYYYVAFPYTDQDAVTINSANRVTATPKAYVLYGVKIDTANSNPATAVTYTDNAVGFTPAKGNNGSFAPGSWADKFPFNEIKPCVLKNGAVNYYLNPNNYAQKADGTASDITSGAAGDVMIEFPKVYWKFEKVGNDLFVRYSDTPIDSTYKCLAHMRGTTVKDKCYISAYLGFDLSSKLRSLSGKIPTAIQTIGAFRTLAKANGANYDQLAYYQILMLQVLYLVMFKDRDSQTALGRGYTDATNTEAITTGGTNAKGMFYGETTGKLQNKFCGIEDFYGNLLYWIDGFFSDAAWNILIGNQNFNDTGSGYTNFGQGATVNVGGYIGSVQGGTETGFVIKTSDGSATTHYPDYGGLQASCLPLFGGAWSNTDFAGAFDFRVSNAASTAAAAFGARLLAL